MKPNLILIDGDLFAYKYAAAGEQDWDWGDGIHSLHSDTAAVWKNIEADIRGCATTAKADKIVVCLSDDRSFRKERVYADYKSHRNGVRKPLGLAELKAKMADVFDVKTKPLLEADDVMGIIATNPHIYPEYNKIICSRDKDMKTIPSVVWNEKIEDGKPVLDYVSTPQADYRHLVQTLQGDVVDGYPGCKGIGAARAAKIAAGGWDDVLEAFRQAGNSDEFALSMARCARILRATDFDYTKQEPILWTPSASIKVTN
jgi:hypothetical protein